MTERPLVIVTRRLPAAVEAALRDAFDVRLNASDEPFDSRRLHEGLARGDALLPTIGDRIDHAVLSATPLRARMIANFGVGTDHIDLATARDRGIVVSNTPGVLTDCTADLTLALILAVMRGMRPAQAELQAGLWTGWRPGHIHGTRVSGKTLGIIGFGRIGQAVARRARHGFGMHVLFHTPHPPPAHVTTALGAETRDSLEALLEECDVVSLHAPATPATYHLINDARLTRMRPGAFLINTARGELVDEDALVSALRSGHLGGAGLDVFRNEPNVRRDLLALPNVVALPHIGSATIETRTAMGLRALANLHAFFRGEDPPDRVA
jgi:lactate dehydrogenase-like 2-hydroxyacid dehydrogenase